MEKTDASFAELSGVASYSTMAHIDFLQGSPVTIMDGARMTMKIPDVSTGR